MTPLTSIALVVRDVQRRPMTYAVILALAVTLYALLRCRRCADLGAHTDHSYRPRCVTCEWDEIERRLGA